MSRRIKPRGLSVGSVCSGIGAPEVAWRELGWRYAWQAEIDAGASASAVLRHHFPGVPNLGDMTAIAAAVRSGEVEAPDLLVGGTPCQSFSVAGLRGGMADARGNLALSFVDLANAIDAVRRAAGQPPCWVLWENVPGVFSDKDNAFGAILGGLVGSSRAVPPGPDGGWDGAGVVDGPDRCAAWRVLDAQHFGVAQRRRRVFVLARGGAVRWSCADALQPLIQGVRWHPAPRREKGARVASSLTAGAGDGSGASRYDPSSETLVTHSLDGSHSNIKEDGSGRGTPLIAFQDRIRGDDGRGYDRPMPVMTDSVGTLETVKPWNVAISFDGTNDGSDATLDMSPTLRAQREGGGNQPSVAVPFVAGTIDTASQRSRGAGTNPGMLVGSAVAFGISSDAVDRSGEGDGTAGQRAGLGVIEDASPSLRARSTNSVAVAFHGSQDPDVSGDITHPVGRNQGLETCALIGYAVRRLMPIECERLQGFPDGHTDVPVPGKNSGQADGPRYKQIGNSMAVPVLRWIGQQIARVNAAVQPGLAW